MGVAAARRQGSISNGSIGRLRGLKVENQLNAFWTVKILAAKNPE
jgi:hypothetical protein